MVEDLKPFQACKQEFLKQFLNKKFGCNFPLSSLRTRLRCLTFAGSNILQSIFKLRELRYWPLFDDHITALACSQTHSCNGRHNFPSRSQASGSRLPGTYPQRLLYTDQNGICISNFLFTFGRLQTELKSLI